MFVSAVSYFNDFSDVFEKLKNQKCKLKLTTAVSGERWDEEESM